MRKTDSVKFKEDKNIYEEPIIEVGNWCSRDNGSKFFSSELDIYPDKEQVMTNCGDGYYDYSVSFDTFLKVAEKIKELRKEKEVKNE